MKILQEIGRILRVEGRLWKTALLLRTSARPLIPLVGSVGYLIGPWDIIPARVPYFGHLDEVTITVIGILTARLLIPADALLANLDQFDFDSMPSGTSAWMLFIWLILHRRVMRSGIHATAFWARTKLRAVRAVQRRTVPEIAFNALGYRSWWRLRSVVASWASDTEGVVVLGGSPRSGTTLLRTVLGRHSLIVSGPETTVFLKRVTSPADLAARMGWEAEEIETWQRQSHSQAEFIRQFGTAVRERSGKPIWLEKTPRNVGRFGYIKRHFPNAKLVHIVRDGRDVVCSLRRTPFARLDHAPPSSVTAAVRCAVQWRSAVEAGVQMRGYRNYYELKYEDLVSAPEQTLRKLLVFLELPWEDRILEPVSIESSDADEIAANSRVFDSSHGRWQRELSSTERSMLRVLIGPTLSMLNYATGRDSADMVTSGSSHGD